MRANALLLFLTGTLSGSGAVRQESFDREPPNWEGINNRSTAFKPKEVVQDFGYNAEKHLIGGGRLSKATHVAVPKVIVKDENEVRQSLTRAGLQRLNHRAEQRQRIQCPVAS